MPVAMLRIMSGLVQGWHGKKRCDPCQIVKVTAEEQEILLLQKLGHKRFSRSTRCLAYPISSAIVLRSLSTSQDFSMAKISSKQMDFALLSILPMSRARSAGFHFLH